MQLKRVLRDCGRYTIPLALGVSGLCVADTPQEVIRQNWISKQAQPVPKGQVSSKITGDLLEVVRAGDISQKNVVRYRGQAPTVDGQTQPDLVATQNNMIAVELIAQSQQGEALEQLLRRQGATIQSREGDVVFAFADLMTIKQIEPSPLVASIGFQSVLNGEDASNNPVTSLLQRLQTAAEIEKSGHTSTPIHSNANHSAIMHIARQDAGVLAAHAQLLHQKQLLGQGIKIGIIDFGYGRYAELQKLGLVPVARRTRSFSGVNPSDQIIEHRNASVHGTACAEIVYKMAPAAEFYLAQVGGGQNSVVEGQMMAAIDWMMQQGVNIINFSGGGYESALDGTAALNQKVQRAIDQNILWVNAAGNFGNKHWSGVLRDFNNNLMIDTGKPGDLLPVVVSDRQNVRIVVNWDDWYGSRKPSERIDIDVFLFNSKYELIDKAEQGRRVGSKALEVISLPLSEGVYHLAISMNGAGTSRTKPLDRRVNVFVTGAHLEQTSTPYAGSIIVPATTEAAISVGAWDISEKNVARYSGQGPTVDGRMKPDLVAPAGASSRAYGNKAFNGTSAAAPYVTGFAAQIWASNRSLSAAQIKRQLTQRLTTSLGGTTPNSSFGYGLIDGRKFFERTQSRSQTPPSPILKFPIQPSPAYFTHRLTNEEVSYLGSQSDAEEVAANLHRPYETFISE